MIIILWKCEFFCLSFADDYPTQKLIRKWIDGEVEHMAWEAQYLYHIEKLGYENFLIAMM